MPVPRALAKANIERVEQILNKNKDGFVHRVLSEHEQALFANKGDSAAYCAKRFTNTALAIIE
jgi:holo-[acyl-carrier protein] synthase